MFKSQQVYSFFCFSLDAYHVIDAIVIRVFQYLQVKRLNVDDDASRFCDYDELTIKVSKLIIEYGIKLHNI